jgi:hypothetical protein
MSVQPLEPEAPAQGRLAVLLRGVNRRIADRSPMTVAALACECASRDCADAVEVPLNLFRVVDARAGLFLVRPGHEDTLERVVRRNGAYVVVERR